MIISSYISCRRLSIGGGIHMLLKFALPIFCTAVHQWTILPTADAFSSSGSSLTPSQLRPKDGEQGGDIGKRVALITGANKGIGKEIVRLLAQDETFPEPWYIFLGSRDEERGKRAVDELAPYLTRGNKIILCPLDITSSSSIEGAVQAIQDICQGQLDVLINNAAICFNDSTLYGTRQHTPFAEQADLTIQTNFYGTLRVTQAIIPLLQKSDSPRIINMAGSAGGLNCLQSEYLIDCFTNPYLELNDLIGLMKEFVSDVENGGIHGLNGWPESPYAASTLGVIAMTKVLARNYKGIMINSVDPGWCATDQNNWQGMLPAGEGAIVPYRMAILPKEDYVTGMNIEG